MRLNASVLVLLVLLVLLASCRKEERPAAPSAPAALPPLAAGKFADAAESAAAARALASARELGGSLRMELLAAFEKGGAASAIEVCASKAPELAAGILARSQVRVGRASTRLRNAATVVPAWVAEWLARYEGRRAAEASGFNRIEGTGAARVARFLAPIAVEGLCLSCHGPVSTLSAEVRASLVRRYPRDRATEYAAGDLRGALWAEAPVLTR